MNKVRINAWGTTLDFVSDSGRQHGIILNTQKYFYCHILLPSVPLLCPTSSVLPMKCVSVRSVTRMRDISASLGSHWQGWTSLFLLGPGSSSDSRTRNIALFPNNTEVKQKAFFSFFLLLFSDLLLFSSAQFKRNSNLCRKVPHSAGILQQMGHSWHNWSHLLSLSSCTFNSLRHCVSAGEPVNPEVMAEWKAWTGLDIHEGYGQTETVR